MNVEVTSRKQRRHRRFVSGGAIDVAWLSSANRICRATAELLNVSHEGLQVESKTPIPVNWIVQVRGKALKRWAWVRYCHRLGNRFLTGFQVLGGPLGGAAPVGVRKTERKELEYVSH